MVKYFFFNNCKKKEIKSILLKSFIIYFLDFYIYVSPKFYKHRNNVIFRKVRLSRYCFKKFISLGLVYAFQKSSW